MCCCCCCRFCCGAPTTDERIHAPALHDASQIAYCRCWGRASLPPINSTLVAAAMLYVHTSKLKMSKFKFEVSTLHGESFQQPENFKIAVGSKIRIFYNLDKLFHRYDKLLKLAANRSSSILFLTHSAVPSCLLLPPAQPSFNTQPKIDAPATPFSCGGSINADVTRDDAVSCAADHVNFSSAPQNVFFLSFYIKTSASRTARHSMDRAVDRCMYSYPFRQVGG